jgi:hypothetical protein
MKKFISLVAGLALIPGMVMANNYTITINDTKYDFALGEQKQLRVGNQDLSVKLEQKETVEFKQQSYSFKHSSKYTPSTTTLEEGIIQTAMMTPLGTVVIVQEYQTLNPSALVNLMVNEVTKEERQYGYKIEASPTSITLSDGTVLKGKVVTSKYSGTDIKRYILTHGARDSGLLVMTQIDYTVAGDEEQVIKTFFDSLVITMK